MLYLETKIDGVVMSYITVCKQKVEGKNKYVADVKYNRLGKEGENFHFSITYNCGDGEDKIWLEVYKQIDKIKKEFA